MKTLQEQQKAEREAQARNSAAVQITSEILKEVLNEETLNSATKEFRQVVLVYYRRLSFISLMNELLSQKRFHCYIFQTSPCYFDSAFKQTHLMFLVKNYNHLLLMLGRGYIFIH